MHNSTENTLPAISQSLKDNRSVKCNTLHTHMRTHIHTKSNSIFIQKKSFLRLNDQTVRQIKRIFKHLSLFFGSALTVKYPIHFCFSEFTKTHNIHLHTFRYNIYYFVVLSFIVLEIW